MFVNTTQK